MGNRPVTDLIADIREGRPSAVESLLPVVYDELRGLAHGIMRQRGPQTLQPTALVNEVCVRLLGSRPPSWESRAHFFAVAAVAMRQVLASYGRAKRADKRTPPGERVTLEGCADQNAPLDLLALDDALTKLTELDPRQAKIVELRFFGGMSNEEVAHVTCLSLATVEREWRAARAFLKVELTGASPS